MKRASEEFDGLVDRALSEAGYPGAVSDGLIDGDVPVAVAWRALSLAEGQVPDGAQMCLACFTPHREAGTPDETMFAARDRCLASRPLTADCGVAR